MSKKRKRQVSRLAVVATALLLAVAALVTGLVVTGNRAQAMDGTQWETVRQYIDAYIQQQYALNGDNEGEAGFYVEQPALKTRLDSNGDGTYLGVGDDAANAPVLIDNLRQLTTAIPQTSFRCRWAEADGTVGDCFTDSSIQAVDELVTAHEAAGFSTDIIDYCQTDHTAAPTTGGFGFIAQTGAYGSGTPNVYGFKWGRNGWTNTVNTYSNTNATGAAGTQTGQTVASNAQCDSEVTNEDLVQCLVNWTIDASGGNVGNGVNYPGSTAAQLIDIRTGSPAATIPGAVQVPINTIFKNDATGLEHINPTNLLLVASRTQGPAGIVAAGLGMLGYSVNEDTGGSDLGGGFLSYGMPNFNNTLDERFVTPGYPNAYSLDTVTGLSAAAKMDTTAPTITVGPSVTPTLTGGTITWTTNDPATSVLEWSLTQGGPYTKVNDTVLNTSHSKTITGQANSTTIYYKVTSYDSQANAASTTESSFETLEPFSVNDRILYLPWYDSITADTMKAWINISNLEDHQVTAEVYVGGNLKQSYNLAADNGQVNFREEDLRGGPAIVRIPNGITSGDDLVVSERTLYKNSFNENLAYDKADASSQYGFPWYDNNAPSGMLGDWFAIVNPSETTTVEVDVYINNMTTPAITRTVPGGAYGGTVDTFQMPTVMVSGPVKVVAHAVGDPGTPMDVICSQRVLFWDTFNEVFGKPLV